MEERELGLAGAVAAIVMAFALVLAVPAHWTVDLAVSPMEFELSAGFAGVHIELTF